jgi:hypothetical protein
MLKSLPVKATFASGWPVLRPGAHHSFLQG